MMVTGATLRLQFDVHHVLPTGVVDKKLRATEDAEDPGKPNPRGEAGASLGQVVRPASDSGER
jgi:hypothetical protein